MAQAVPAAALTPPPTLDHDPIRLNRIMISSFCLSMISGQTLRVCPEGKPVSTFPDHALVPPIGCREFVLGTSNRNGIRIIDLPMPSCFRSSCQKLLRCITNFGSRAPGRFRRAMSRFVASASRPEVSSILPCAADFCLMSKPALPYKRDADEKRIGAVGAPGEEAR